MEYFFVVVNPAAGVGKTLKMLPLIQNWLRKNQLKYQLVLSTERVGVVELLRYFSEKYTSFVIIGGDGTLNEALNGLPNFNKPIGVVQTGSGNDFYRALGGSTQLEKQLHRAFFAPAKTIDIGRCNNRYFINGVGVGFDGEVAKKANELKKKGTGKGWAYYAVILSQLFKYKGIKLQVALDNLPERTIDTLLITVGNGTSFGSGFKLTNKAKIDDGLLDVCLIHNLPVGKRIVRFIWVLLGKHNQLKAVEYQTTRKITIKANTPFSAHIDGESFSSQTIDIQILASQLLLRY